MRGGDFLPAAHSQGCPGRAQGLPRAPGAVVFAWPGISIDASPRGVRAGMINHLVTDVADGVQTVRFDRIEAENALTSAMCEAAADAIAFGESSSRVRAILIMGSPGLFTSGHDRNDLADFAAEGAFGQAVIRLSK